MNDKTISKKINPGIKLTISFSRFREEWEMYFHVCDKTNNREIQGYETLNGADLMNLSAEENKEYFNKCARTMIDKILNGEYN